MWFCKKYQIYDYNFWYTNEGYLHKKQMKFRDIVLNLCDNSPRNIQTDRQTKFKLSDGINIKNVTTRKKKTFSAKYIYLFKQEYLFKSYAEHPLEYKIKISNLHS